MPRAKIKCPASPEVALVDQYLKLSAKNKALFREMNDIEEQLLAIVDRAPDARVALPDNRVLTRKDNFADRNTFFKPSATKRFEIVVA